MPEIQQPVRKVTWDDATPNDLAELARDLRAKLASIPLLKLLQFEMLYTEPMYWSFDHLPASGFIVTRIRQRLASQDTVTLTGGTVHYAWEGTRAKVNSIDGMSPGSGLTFIFDVLAVG